MQLKTKYQKALAEKLKALKPLSSAKKKWLIDVSFFNYAMSHYSSLICNECTHKWKDSFNERKHVKCPKCKKTLKHASRHNSGYTSFDSHGVFFDRVGDVAVIRIFTIKKHLKKGEKSSYSIKEVIRKCFDMDNQKFSLFQCTLNGMMGNYSGGWSHSSELEFRSHTQIFDYRTQVNKSCVIYPYKKIPKRFIQAGFSFAEDAMVSDYDRLMYVLLDPRMETLYKYKEDYLLRYFMRTRMTKKHWSALKIAFRRHYLVEPKFHIRDWLDLVGLLIEFKADVSSPHYVCPDDFHAMHQKFVKKAKKKRKAEQERIAELDAIRRKEAHEKHKREAIEDAKKYVEMKKKYFSLIFKEKDITIQVMKSIDQFIKEGDLLEHCIFANKYYKREESLMLSARIKGKVTETVEVNLETMEVEQARGYDNLPTEHHDRIVKLVNKNLKKIEKVHKTEAA